MDYENNPERPRDILEILFKLRVSPNAEISRGSWPWVYLLRLLYLGGREPVSSGFGLAIETFLKYGASRPEWYLTGEMTGDLRVTIKFHPTGHENCVHGLKPEELPPCLVQEGGIATMRDWVEHLKPENAATILELLDGDSAHEDAIVEDSETSTNYLPSRFTTHIIQGQQ